ncbi:unnamed protein product, partial [Durusdinium trenchii]
VGPAHPSIFTTDSKVEDDKIANTLGMRPYTVALCEILDLTAIYTYTRSWNRRSHHPSHLPNGSQKGYIDLDRPMPSKKLLK